MNKAVLILMSILFPIVCLAQTGTIVVHVKGIDASQGEIQIGLFKNANDFPNHSKVFKGAKVAASKNGVTYQFTDIPLGTYALAVFHDKNRNKQLDKNMFGVPTESYGFSNNVYGTFGPPDFQAVCFRLTSEKNSELTIIID
jgi:uncharacterized protein (DUF2141 family)